MEAVGHAARQRHGRDRVTGEVLRVEHDELALVGAVIVHEAVTFSGIGAEISSQIQEVAFDYLDAPVLRIGAPFSPVPFSPVLERAYIPDSARIEREVTQLLQRSAG